MEQSLTAWLLPALALVAGVAIGFMIARLLPTAGKTTADAADALAVAIAHAHHRKLRRIGAAA